MSDEVTKCRTKMRQKPSNSIIKIFRSHKKCRKLRNWDDWYLDSKEFDEMSHEIPYDGLGRKMSYKSVNKQKPSNTFSTS